MTGRLVALEGGEGTGKSTQARLLAAELERRGIRCIVTREPGGTIGAEAIRNLLLDPAMPEWTIEAEALLFAAARADHVARLIRPALAAGQWVICDRFVDSSRAYQGAAGELGDGSILDLHRIGSGGLLPDVTLLLKAADEEVTARLSDRDGLSSDKIGGRSDQFHRRVAEAFQLFAQSDPHRFRRIDASGTPADVLARILIALGLA